LVVFLTAATAFTAYQSTLTGWAQVVTHEFPMSQAEEAFKISATQQCGKILLYPHRK
jgi:threonine dehydrogenase-like Zn-dependent dehydrogenase